MRPKERRDSGQSDFFKARLDEIVDMGDPLAKLASTVDWRFLEERFGAVYSDKPGQPPLPTDDGAFDPQAHARSVGRGSLWALGREPVLRALLWRGVLPSQAAVRPIVADAMAPADGRGEACLAHQESLNAAPRTGAAKPPMRAGRAPRSGGLLVAQFAKARAAGDADGVRPRRSRLKGGRAWLRAWPPHGHRLGGGSRAMVRRAGQGGAFGLSWPVAFDCENPPILAIGFPWISLDSLVRIETYQWVTRETRAKNFHAAFRPLGRLRRRHGRSPTRRCGSTELSMAQL